MLGMLYQETVAHHPGERVQWRPCWQGDDSGCCPDCQRGVWGEEAGRGWGSLWDQQRQDVRAGVVEQQAVEGSEHQGRRGRSVYLWFLLSDTDMKGECSRCIRYKRAIKFLAKNKNKKLWPLSLWPAVDRGSSLSPLIGCPSTIFL